MAYGNEKPPSKLRYLRPGLYGFWFFLIFACAAVELGLVSYFLQAGGKGYEGYPSKEYKHDLGIILFSCIVTFIFVLSHTYVGHFIAIVISFILAVFWGTGAGVLFSVSPFKAYTCGRPAESFTPNWAAYHSKCRRVVTMMAFAWTLWGLFLFLLVALLAEFIKCTRRPGLRPYYKLAPIV